MAGSAASTKCLIRVAIVLIDLRLFFASVNESSDILQIVPNAFRQLIRYKPGYLMQRYTLLAHTKYDVEILLVRGPMVPGFLRMLELRCLPADPYDTSSR